MCRTQSLLFCPLLFSSPFAFSFLLFVLSSIPLCRYSLLHRHSTTLSLSSLTHSPIHLQHPPHSQPPLPPFPVSHSFYPCLCHSHSHSHSHLSLFLCFNTLSSSTTATKAHPLLSSLINSHCERTQKQQSTLFLHLFTCIFITHTLPPVHLSTSPKKWLFTPTISTLLRWLTTSGHRY